MLTPYPYQEEGGAFLAARHRAYLADDMGLGKTVQAIIAAQRIEAERTLIVCPASVSENWRREWAAWYGPGEILVVSYAMLSRGNLPALEDYDLVILDEAHYCKTPSSKRTKAALKLAAAAPNAWLLSGTPVPNDPRELYPVFRALWPEHLERYGIRTAFDWMDRYCVWGNSDFGYTVWGNTPLAVSELVPALQKVMLRRRLQDVALDLPALRTTVQYLDPDPDLAQKLEQMGGGMDEYMSTIRRVLGEYKATPIAARLVEELTADPKMKIVVMYHHRTTGDALRYAFEQAKIRTTGFHGSTIAQWRQQRVDLFQDDPNVRVFLAQQTAAGVGITLTRASEIVLVEPSWSPEDNRQAIKRIHRIGQDAPCRARLFAVPDSLDEAVMNTLARKSAMVKEITG